MKQIMLIILSLILLVGCSSINPEEEIVDQLILIAESGDFSGDALNQEQQDFIDNIENKMGQNQPLSEQEQRLIDEVTRIIEKQDSEMATRTLP